MAINREVHMNIRMHAQRISESIFLAIKEKHPEWSVSNSALGDNALLQVYRKVQVKVQTKKKKLSPWRRI